MPCLPRGSYPPDWKQIATDVKDAAGWRCIRCDHDHDVAAGYMLTVHHLDSDKSNCAWWNLTALCQRCYLHIQGKVTMEQTWPFPHTEWFRPYVAGYYAQLHDLSTGRPLVLGHVDTLIALGQGRTTRERALETMTAR